MTMLAYLIYSALLTMALVLSAPWWLVRMVTTERYREGLKQRTGFVPPALRGYAAGHKIVWLHAVSVGEVLAASRLIGELEVALGDGWRVVISTTTRTGQTLAKDRFGAERVFYMPLDFAFAVRAYLRALHPAALILMESELWPRLLHECGTRNIPAAVVNARISDRSYRRASRVRAVWARVLRMPTLWLAQSEEDARRLRSLIEAATPSMPGAPSMTTASSSTWVGSHNANPTILTTGNLKYDIRAPQTTPMTAQIARLFSDRTIVVGGSTTGALNEDGHNDEEDFLVGTWSAIHSAFPEALLMIAPRHPERFAKAIHYMHQVKGLVASKLGFYEERKTPLGAAKVLCLDTIGDLASVYSLATIAFVGGSLVQRGGHNPLEPAQFGVPVVMGPSYENFRDIVGRMLAADAIRIVEDKAKLQLAIEALLKHPDEARALGERGRAVFKEQQGATARTTEALVDMIAGAQR